MLIDELGPGGRRVFFEIFSEFGVFWVIFFELEEEGRELIVEYGGGSLEMGQEGSYILSGEAIIAMVEDGDALALILLPHLYKSY